MKKCTIKTPDVCSNGTLRDVLNKIITQSEIRNPIFDGTQFDRTTWIPNVVMWTGATRYNETHFKDSVRFINSPLG